mmetsp:Transcript_13000/g.23570  ORF Transcript_13000/g.23570 Transcript_13000/m.23570 type:complete len:90 (+) Transcript_13000:784-1053(+)
MVSRDEDQRQRADEELWELMRQRVDEELWELTRQRAEEELRILHRLGYICVSLLFSPLQDSILSYVRAQSPLGHRKNERDSHKIGSRIS